MDASLLYFNAVELRAVHGGAQPLAHHEARGIVSKMSS